VAKVSPVFKTGDRKDRSNYRPISVLPVVSNIFEKLILIILQKVPHKSVMYWYKHMDKGDIDIAVFIDLKKAFDPVDHNILLNKLMRYGIKDSDYNGSSHIYRIGLNADMQWSSFKQPNNIMRSTTGLYPWTAVIFYIHQ
jgi:hypothetical protein